MTAIPGGGGAIDRKPGKLPVSSLRLGRKATYVNSRLVMCPLPAAFTAQFTCFTSPKVLALLIHVREFQAGYVPAACCVGVSTQVHLQMRRRSDGQVLSLLLSLLALLVQKYKH
jgi:hypothetical protein